ncbi:hypothetical protein SMGD1_0205 [Sulfurimonas gotlandica GD1]|uniref:Uncharacterized protein n=1 Tax=Sulfurimonas gotlandica (strain DSM 19862 / JCM 16533 / GD1) TaxID=929558 RepID=B6BL00_SULGG|nr:hypothetical protein [Sulfurimonas gotlandica]EDZ62087.1 conserved hypothetical protein [Sulfurimonas gotlandica GD1]EHP28732.1 hypothetical protein SMGD1_0205 [Sulfurimonas gotlandica GD1]
MLKFINREQLYKHVWSNPFTKLALKYNVSAVELKKLCNKFLIPVPKMGHWQKIAFGKEIYIPPLTSYKYISVLLKKRKAIPVIKGIASNIKLKKTIFLAAKKTKITVKQTLTSPHTIIAKTRDSLKSKKIDEYGMITSGKDCADIRISPANYKKVLRVLDALFKWFENRGYEVNTSNGYGTCIIIDKEKIQIAVEEKSTVTNTTVVGDGFWKRTEREYTPSNKISLLIKSYNGNTRRTWSAGKLYTLEELLPSFIDGILNFATAMKENKLRREEEDRKRKEARILKRYNSHCEELEKNMIEQLEKQAKDWNFTMQLQNYISAIDDKAKKENGGTLTKDMLKWIEWANQYLDKINPLNGSLPYYSKAEELLSINHFN